MTRRICDVVSSVYGEAPTMVDGTNCRAGEGLPTDPPDSRNASISRLMIRPLGPEPETLLRSIEFSAAIRAAMGETIRRPFDVGCSACFVDGGGVGAADISFPPVPLFSSSLTATASPPADAGGSDLALPFAD